MGSLAPERGGGWSRKLMGRDFLRVLLQRNENRGRFVVFYAFSTRSSSRFSESEGGKLTREFMISWKRKIIKANEIGKLFNDIKIKH